MVAFRSILVPLDGSDASLQVLSYVQALQHPDLTVTLLEVVPESRGFVPYKLDVEYGSEVYPEVELAENILSDLQRFADELVAGGILSTRLNVHVVVGDPAEMILENVDTQNANLVALATRGRGAVKRALFGSVTERVMRHSQVPVLIVRPRNEAVPGEVASIRRIVVPLDGSLLAEGALPTAQSLAQQLGIPIVLIQAVPLDAVAGFSAAIPQRTLDGILQFARDYLSSIRDHLVRGGTEVTVSAEIGQPFDVINTLAEFDDLVIMTSHGRTGFKRWLMGSVADKVIHACSAPVVLVPTRHALVVAPAGDN